MAAKKLKVTFLETRIVQDGLEGTPEETRFEKGKAYSLPESSARRWISRGAAMLTKDYLKQQKQEMAKEKPPSSPPARPGGTSEEDCEGLRGQIDELTEQGAIYEEQISRCRAVLLELGLDGPGFDRLMDCPVDKTAAEKQVEKTVAEIRAGGSGSETPAEPVEPSGAGDSSSPETFPDTPVDRPVEGDDALFGADDKSGEKGADDKK